MLDFMHAEKIKALESKVSELEKDMESIKNLKSILEQLTSDLQKIVTYNLNEISTKKNNEGYVAGDTIIGEVSSNALE